MALGFGFNKVKVLASAEKYVQQGKLPNAIAEYEKVIKEDPKDLTVLNTIGDLYVRLGQNDQATHYFRKVGDQYAQSGFTVKAIAIYKKLTKLGAQNAEILNKLAELYSQQGLFNDARAHYMQVADHLLKGGDNDQAARTFQRILELDPENVATQAKLAELYQKLGKKDEARSIYFSAAESLYARGSHGAAQEALDKVLSMDPANGGALLLRGMIAVDSGDGAEAVRYLEKVPDLDTKFDGLRALLRAKLQSGSADGAEAVADKLLDLHNDVTGITSLAQWYVTNDHLTEALQLYEKHSQRLMKEGVLEEAINPLVNRTRENPEALASVQRLLKLVGDNSHGNEIMEMQAHACAQKGDYVQARDLYKSLADLEPENALHTQNYKQMLAKLGEDSATRILSPEEAAQAFMVEELDETAPHIQQSYDPPTEKAIESALTDAELYVSYNVPAKAIAPLEAALPLAPKDVALNQRLATLYARSERFGDAARMCLNLSEIYQELGHTAESAKYLEASRKYALRAPGGVPSPSVVSPPPAVATPRPQWPPVVQPVQTDEAMAASVSEMEATPAEDAASSVQEFSFDLPEPAAAAPETAPAFTVELVPQGPMLEEVRMEPAVPVMEDAASVDEVDLSNEWEEMMSVETPAAGDETDVEEMPVAMAEFSADPTSTEVGPVPAAEIELVPASTENAPTHDHAAEVEQRVREVRSFIAHRMWEAARSSLLDLKELAGNNSEINGLEAEIAAGEASMTAVAAAPVDIESPVVAPVELSPGPLAPIEEPVLDDLVAEPQEGRPAAASPRASAPSTEDILSDFVLDLEQSDLADFAPQPPAKTPSPALVPAAAPAAAAAVRPMAKANGHADIKDRDSANALSDILSELREENTDAAEQEEDPETHYNLGIAFKEMGLLDEAIGELQKVCHAVDRGASFSQPVQALTWLAQCLVDKGAPEAAVRWYQKALLLPGLDAGSRCAIYYDLGRAFEDSGDKKSALTNFMEVYGSNIDFRDVATRIKALKS